MRRADYLKLLTRVATQGRDSSLHWVTGPNAGTIEPWDGELASVPGQSDRALPHGCYESEKGCCYPETLMGQPRLVIVGAGHVGQAVARIGSLIGFRVVVIDERPALVEAAIQQLSVAEGICDGYAEALAALPNYDNDYFVIVTPGHRADQESAENCLRRPFQYVGMIGSRGKVASVRANLTASGIEDEVLAQLHAPIGLHLGGREPAEIAVSICAQLIQERAAKKLATFDPAVACVIRELVDNPNLPAVLATIVGHGGSAPRGSGSRMLVDTEGIRAGSVGGGALEGAVVQRSHLMLAAGTDLDVLDYRLSNQEGAELGMICGGRVRLLLESL